MSTKVTTGKGRLSYQSLYTPTAMNDSQEKKYETSFIFPKTDKVTVDKIKEAIEEAKQEGIKSQAPWKGKVPTKDFKNPLHDGDEEKPDQPEYAGMYYITARSKNQPNVVDRALNVITDKNLVYSGANARISVNFFPFSKGSNGIGCGLNNVQMLGGGEPLSGGSTAEEDFAEAIEDDDFM